MKVLASKHVLAALTLHPDAQARCECQGAKLITPALVSSIGAPSSTQPLRGTTLGGLPKPNVLGARNRGFGRRPPSFRRSYRGKGQRATYLQQEAASPP